MTVSSGDRYVRALAIRLERELSALRQLRRTYEQGDRELKEAVANISHDLRTPMTTISGFIDGITTGAIPPEKHEYYLKIIRDDESGDDVYATIEDEDELNAVFEKCMAIMEEEDEANEAMLLDGLDVVEDDEEE